MKLLVGLGNPGETYQKNRHNVGFLFVDFLADLKKGEWKYDKYLSAEICSYSESITLAKPQTYMNRSGESVKELFERYTLTANDLIIVHDDLDIPLGKFKIQMQGPKQHNGLASIQNKLRTNDFLRVRIGVDNRPPENRIDGETYVLGDFTEEERKIVEQLLPEIAKRLALES